MKSNKQTTTKENYEKRLSLPGELKQVRDGEDVIRGTARWREREKEGTKRLSRNGRLRAEGSSTGGGAGWSRY